MSYSSKKKPKKKPGRVLAPIRGDEVYSLALLRAITGWGDSAIRAARRAGLKPVYLHGRVFYRGCDLVPYFDSAVQDQYGGDQPPARGDR